MPGRLIVVEGPDGVGKTTATANLEQKVRTHHSEIKLVRLRQPAKYREEIGATDPKNWLRMLYLFMKDREEQYHSIKQLLESGHDILMDRYYHSSCVYQGLTGKVHPQEILNAHGNFYFIPDVTLVLHGNGDIIEDRLKRAKGSSSKDLENFEADFEFRKNVREIYGNLHTVEGFEECVPVSCEGTAQEVVDAMWVHVAPVLGLV